MVRINTGFPPIGRNCLGSSHPMRKPLPPATIRTYFIGFTQPLHKLQSDNHRLFQFGNFILALQQFHYRQSKLHGSARTFSCNDIAVFFHHRSSAVGTLQILFKTRIASSFLTFQQSQFAEHHRSGANGCNRFVFFGKA